MMEQKFVDLQVHDETLSDVSVNLRTRLATKTESNHECSVTVLSATSHMFERFPSICHAGLLYCI